MVSDPERIRNKVPKWQCRGVWQGGEAGQFAGRNRLLCDVRGNAKVFVFSRYGVRLIERNSVAYATEFGSHSASLRIAAFICFWPTGQFASGDSDVFLGICYRGSGVEIGWLRRSDQRACDDSNETTCHPCD